MRISNENLDNYGRNWNSIICYKVEKMNVRLKEILKGGNRDRTGDLSICSRMLYHWAMPPDNKFSAKFKWLIPS